MESEEDFDSDVSKNESLEESDSEDQQEGPEGKRQKISALQAQEPVVLKLKKRNVFTLLLTGFSQDRLPNKIVYDGQSYNLTKAYDEFWETFYDSTHYSEGHKVKLPKMQNLSNSELRSVVKILKRGWEDERYWPRKLSRPFLESCMYNRRIGSIKRRTFLKFINTSDKLLIKDEKTVNQNVLDVLKKYCSANTISIGDDVKGSCRKAAYEIMVTNMMPVTEIWRVELRDLMPISTFDFLMSHNSTSFSDEDYWVDIEDEKVPHKLWQTFFLGWTDEQVQYYFHALVNGRYGSSCNLCRCQPFNAKHFLCTCDDLLDTLRRDRHDAVLKILLEQIHIAMNKRVKFFSRGNDWNVLSYFQNKRYDWPEELSILNKCNKYPHIVVYTMSPIKRALVIEHSISWEHSIDLQKKRKTKEYVGVKNLLKSVGFLVEYRVVVLGSRGVLIPDLYKLFEEIFSMKHAEISMAHEEISREILNIPFHSKYYKKAINTY